MFCLGSCNLIVMMVKVSLSFCLTSIIVSGLIAVLSAPGIFTLTCSSPSRDFRNRWIFPLHASWHGRTQGSGLCPHWSGLRTVHALALPLSPDVSLTAASCTSAPRSPAGIWAQHARNDGNPGQPIFLTLWKGQNPLSHLGLLFLTSRPI